MLALEGFLCVFELFLPKWWHTESFAAVLVILFLCLMHYAKHNKTIGFHLAICKTHQNHLFLYGPMQNTAKPSALHASYAKPIKNHWYSMHPK